MSQPGFTNRFRLGLMIVSVAIFVAASLVVAVDSEHVYETQAEQVALVEARVLADTVTAALAFGDRSAAQEYVNALGANAEVDAVGVFDQHGDRIAGYTRSHLAGRLADLRSPANAPNRAIVFVPVTQKGERLGTVYLRNRPTPLLRRLSRYVGPGLIVLLAAVMFVVSTLDSLALQRANRELELQIEGRAKAEAALRQSQKMEAIGRLTGGVAHDFNNMLAVVMGSLDLLLRRYAQGEPRMLRLASQAMEGAKRAAALTQRLLAFSRLQPLAPKSVDITRAMREMTELLRRTLGETVVIETVLAGGLWRAHIDLPQLETAILNLAINARDAMAEGGRLTIETGNAHLDRAYALAEQDVAPGQYVMVAITDTGVGIPAELLEQVFEPFFTTKPVGLGTGLGLSQVHGFIKQSGGHIRIYSEVGVGTSVKLYLPRSHEEAELSTTEEVRTDGARRRDLTVLVVEDEPGVREFAIEALHDLGFDVLSADGPKSALEVLQSPVAIDVLLTDVVMPGANGRALADQALRLRPLLRVIYMTGYTSNAIVHNGMLDPGTHLVSKPFTVTQLEAELDAVLGVR